MDIAKRSPSTETKEKLIQRTPPTSARLNRLNVRHPQKRRSIFTPGDEQILQQQMQNLQEKHNQLITSEVNSLTGQQMEKLKRRADQYCAQPLKDNKQKPSISQRGNKPYKLASVLSSFIRKILNYTDRKLIHSKMSAFNKIKQYKRKTEMRSRSTVIKRRFVADEDPESQEQESRPFSKNLNSKQKKNHELTITYNVYEVDVKNFAVTSDGLLILNNLRSPVLTNVYSGDSIQLIRDNFQGQQTQR